MWNVADAHLAVYNTVSFMAQAEPEPPQGPEFGKASPVGIPVVLLLLIATVLLVWNMNSRIKNLPESFDAENPEADQLADDGTDAGAVADAADTDRLGDDDAGESHDRAEGRGPV